MDEKHRTEQVEPLLTDKRTSLPATNSANGKEALAAPFETEKKMSEGDQPVDAVVAAEDEETRCGRFHNVKVFLFLMCLFSITQGFAVNGINNVNIPMLERRFKLSSTQTGLEASFYDIIAGSVVLLVGYFGAHYHQPRLLGLASAILAFGSLTMALPHFLTSDYKPDDDVASGCSAGNATDTDACLENNSSLSKYLYVLLAGQGLHGLAGTILYVIGPAYIDGSVSSHQSATYLGIFYGSAALGPAMGYMIGGWLLDQYVDFPKPPPGDLTPHSPSWVGAWWIGFLGTFMSCLLLAFPLCTFPRVLPGTAKRRKNIEDQAHNNNIQHKASEQGFGVSIRDLPVAIQILIRNPAFVCQCIIGACEGLLLSGMSTFLPKFIANQFYQKASFSSILTGLMAVPAAAAGQLLGGIIIRKFNMKVKDILRYNLCCSVGVILFASTFWARCDGGNIAGVTVPYEYNNYNATQHDTAAHGLALNHTCNSQCTCTTANYKPLCIDGIEYFSPCHAGCPSNINHSNTMSSFSDCSCSSQISSEGKSGKCDTSCFMLYIFAPLAFFAFLGTFMISVPGTTIIFRSVNDKQRTFAISISQMCMRFLGTIPGPILFGFTLDKACLVWQEKCNEIGSCWIYDNEELGRNFYILMVSVKLVSVSMMVIAYKLYKPPDLERSMTQLKLIPETHTKL